jgi:phage terminase large subunit-like protein
MARQMIEADETLSSLVNIVPSTKHLAVEALFSFYAALSSEGSTKTAYNPSLVIVDEAQDLIDAQLVRNLTSGRTARDDYLTLYIGTAGCRKDTLFYEEYEYAKKWKAGIVENDTYHAWVYESPEEDDWTLESSWKYHPAWGTFCKPQNVRDEFKAAKDNHSEEIKFKQFFLNRWQIYSGVNWIADRDWMANSEPPLGDGKEYYAGYDGASVYDTTSLVLFGANSQGSWDVIPYIWINESQLEQRKTAEFDYQQWQKAGFLQVIPGPIQDEDVIAARIKEVIERYPVKMFSIDRNGQTKMTIHLQSMGFVPGQSLVGFGQGAVSMSEPIKQIERLVIGKQLRHGGHPVLRWMCSNVKLNRDDKENYSFSKKHSKEKIDGCVALACAVGVAVPAISTAAVGLGQSVYETRGLLVL